MLYRKRTLLSGGACSSTYMVEPATAIIAVEKHTGELLVIGHKVQRSNNAIARLVSAVERDIDFNVASPRWAQCNYPGTLAFVHPGHDESDEVSVAKGSSIPECIMILRCIPLLPLCWGYCIWTYRITGSEDPQAPVFKYRTARRV